MLVKFMYNGIKVDGKLYKAYYSKGNMQDKDIITIYAKEYQRFPKVDGLQVKNETDIMTDYFEKDHIYLSPSNKYYQDALKVCNIQQAKWEAKRAV